FYEVLTSPDGLSAGAQKKFAQFTEIATDLVEKVKTMGAEEFMTYVLVRSGVQAALAASGDIEDQNRLENISELVSAVKQFIHDNPEMGMSDFMQSVALVSDTDDMDGEDYVTIATVHAVKGLEFDNVFIVGLEEGIFPTQRAITSGDIEEERRLMYVAITRARRKLFVLNSRSRYRFGRVENMPKSRFVGEMSGVRQSVRFSNSNYNAGTPSADRNRIKLGANNMSSQSFKNRFDFGSKPAARKDDIDYDKYTKDTIVEHNKFGKGIITMTSGDGEDKIASIAFQGLGVKRFSLAIAASSLKIIGHADDYDSI
ncbi:MAG: ATP-binding domain-containing protein, partial [Clostridia bacterium]|nr:ATP-binding domain-containing protein [Clostridia bacterium]